MRESKKGKGGAPKSQAFISGRRKKPNTQTFSGRWAVDEEKEQDKDCEFGFHFRDQLMLR